MVQTTRAKKRGVEYRMHTPITIPRRECTILIAACPSVIKLTVGVRGPCVGIFNTRRTAGFESEFDETTVCLRSQCCIKPSFAPLLLPSVVVPR
jgi:hypothetical protein